MSNFTSNYHYNQIINPETNRIVNINSRTGKKVLEKYKTLLNVSQHGGQNIGTEWMDISDKIPIINKHGKTYYGIFINGNKWHEVNNKKNWVAHSIVQSNTGYFKKSNKWRFDPAEGALRESEKCGVILPKKKGCYSIIVIDPDFEFQSGVPGIAGYIIASHHKTNEGPFKNTDFIYIDYVEVSTDYQGEGLCKPMVSSIINKFQRDYGITSFKIWNASYMRGPARSCYIKAAHENNLDIYHTPYYLNDGGNFPVYKCGTCKVNIDKLENELVNGDEEEIYYMVPKNILTEIYGTTIECHDYYPDSEE